jgi:acetyl-CoA synthetase
MKLGGIKISAAEIERCIAGLDHIIETAAIAVPPSDRGPNRLIIFAATHESLDKKQVHQSMQIKINRELNPLFKIHDVVFMKDLPKTASNKIMRRVLRDQYKSGSFVKT